MYFFYVLFALLLFSPSLRAQDSDVRSWTTVKVSRAVFSGATLTGSFEYRTKDNISSTDRYGGQLSLGWKLSSLLKLGCGYEVHYQNKSSNGWKFRQRYHVDGTLTKKISLFNLSFRERFQHTFRKNEHDFRLRSRLKLQCVKDKFIASPYLSCEMYNNLCNNESPLKSQYLKFYPSQE